MLRTRKLPIPSKYIEGRLTVVGDEDQTLYGYRGVENNSLSILAGSEASEVGLRYNYRSTQALIDFGAKLFHMRGDRNAYRSVSDLRMSNSQSDLSDLQGAEATVKFCVWPTVITIFFWTRFIVLNENYV